MKKNTPKPKRRQCPHCGKVEGPIENGGFAICPGCGRYSQAPKKEQPCT